MTTPTAAATTTVLTGNEVPAVLRRLGVTRFIRGAMPRTPTYLGKCQCRTWPMAALIGRGRCGRCGTGTEYVGPDPQSPTA